MQNKCKKAVAFAMSLALTSVNFVGSSQNSNIFIVKASETNSKVNETKETTSVTDVASEQELDETYYDAETQTLHLKGYVRNGGEGTGIILPDGVVENEVKYLVADKGTVLPEDCSWLMCNLDAVETADFKNADSSNVTNMAYMFSPSSSIFEFDYVSESDPYSPLRKIDLTGFDTSKVTDMRGTFQFLIHLKEIDVSSFDTSNVTDMSSMFCFCNIESLDLSNFDTSNVTDMSYMFETGFWYEPFGCHALNLKNFNTSKVTDMSGMFLGCYSLPTNDIKNFDTSNVTDMSGMFARSVVESEPLDLSKFDTSNVTDMSSMFTGLSGVSSLDLSSFDTSNVTDMSYMLCTSCLESLDISSFNTSNVTNMSNMFLGCKVSSLDLSNFDTSNVTDMSYMFEYCELSSLDLSNFDTSNVTNMRGMFEGSYFDSVDLSSFDTSNVTDMTWMFDGCKVTSLDLASFDTSNVTLMRGMFERCTVDSLDLSNFDTSKVTEMTFMFEKLHLSSLDLSSFDTRNVTGMYGMFSDCSELETIIVGDFWSTEKVNDYGLNYMFDGCKNLKGGQGTVYDENNIGIEYAHVDGGVDNPGYLTLAEYINDESYFDEETGTLHLKGEVRCAGYYKGLVLPKGTDRLKVEHIVAEEGTVLPKDCSYLCALLPYLKTADLHNADTSNVTDMSSMFAWNDSTMCDKTYINVSGFDTSKVKNMNRMFFLYEGTELDVSSFDTSSVTDMALMFGECHNLKSIDVSSFDASNVSDMHGMFENCDSLETITVGEGWTTEAVEESDYMFAGCENLKGGAGTVYDEDHTDVEYARIDGGKDAPGYFTAVKSDAEEDEADVIVIPKEVKDTISYLYNSINDPTLKSIVDSAIRLFNKFFSFKIV